MAYGLRTVARYIVNDNMLINCPDDEDHTMPDTRSVTTATTSMASQYGPVTLAESRLLGLMVTRMVIGNRDLLVYMVQYQEMIE